MSNKRKIKRKWINISIAILSVALILTGTGIVVNVTNFLSGQKLSGNNFGNRLVDPNTMDSYQELLINEKNGSRYAGRIWADKSVLTDDLKLDMATDGYAGFITNNSDFLHVFSALGSSLNVSQSPQLDVMLLIDVSGSMGKVGNTYATESNFSETPIYKTIQSVNQTINTLLGENPNSRFGVAVYGSTAEVLVPLGHYTKVNEAPFLNVKYLETYGGTSNPQGLHFELSAYVKNQADEVKEYYVDNSGITNNVAHGKAGNGNRNVPGTGGQTTGSGTKEEPFHVGHLTNQQAGLAVAMDQFITENNEIIWKANNNKNYPRIPALIHLSDGQASDAAWIQDKADINSNDIWKRTASTWNNVNWKYDLAYNSTNNTGSDHMNFYNAYQLSGLGAASPLIFQTLMTASYYKSAVDAYYASSGLKDIYGNVPTLNCYSIYASDSSEYDEMEDKQVKGTINAILNPSDFFKDDLDSDVFDSSELDSADPGAKFIDTAYELYKLWLNDKEEGVNYTFSSKTTSASDSQNDITININAVQSQLTDGSGAYSKEVSGKDYPWVDKITVDAIKDNIYYVPSGNFFNTNFENIGSVFDSVIKSVVKSTFVPIGGVNDAGTSDSLTFVDPIGKYLNVKEKALTIDGEKYDMSLLLFGKLHNMKKAAIYDYTFNSTHRGPNHDSDDMRLDFTSGWYDKDGNYLEEDGSWDKGDTYYADVTQVQKYIPTLDETNNITPKQKKTIYTLYSYVDEDGNVDLQNPCYDNTTVTYKLNDIRVWTEYTGNYLDDIGVSPELGYDNALYVNIPVNALPLQTAKVEIEDDDHIKSYSTNLDEKTQSTPLRLFYSVGIDDSIMTEDGLDIDLAKVNQEYIQANKKNDTIYFYSNYYSATKYDGYVTDTQDERTRGDAYFSFSPDKSNRYYTFQKALPLYEVATSDSKNDKGGYNEIPLEDENAYNVFKTTHNNITDSQKLNPDSWYYIVVDYYMPGQDTIMRLAVPREGKEFGSGIAGGSVDAGAYLSWYSQSLDKYVNFVVGDAKPSDADDYVIATRPGGLRVGDLAQSLRQKSQNNTQTSRSYYLPTVSTSNDNIVIDDFLGNNGRLDVSDSLMMIAKEVKTTPFGEKTIDRSRDYQFEVKIDGHEGDYSAIKMYKNPYSNEWQLRLSTIDILTDNDGFLQDKDTKLYVYEDDGQQYYVYIGDNEIEGDTGGDDVFRVYSAPDNDNHIELTKSGMTTYVTDPNTIEGATKLNKYKKADNTHTLGSIDFWIDKVYLIPTNIVDEKTWDHSLEGYKTLTEFVVAHLDSMKKGVDELTTSYKTETSYLTTTLKFGYTAQNKPETKPTSWTDDEWDSQKEHIAKLVLKDNEGIMLSGLKSGVNYETIEEITTKDNKEGYYFEEIKLGEEDTATITDKTVKGRVNANYIDEVEYINRYYAPTSLAIKKTVSGSLGEKDKDWTFDLTITLPPSAVILDSYDYHYDVIDGVTKRADGKITFESLTDNHYLAHLSIKHGETLVIEGLPEGTTYEVSENDANQNGYVTTSLNEVGTLRPTQTDVSFENSKIAKSDLTITKEVQGLLGDKEKEWEFEVTLKPSIEQDFPTNYVYTGTKNGTLELTPKEDAYVGKITLKHNDTITIKDIPENTTYEIKELDASKNGYISNAQNATGLIKGEGVYEARFTNIKYERHSLTISKEVTGSAGDKNKNWKFKIVFTPDTDVIFDKNYPYDGGTLELTEKDGKYTGEITLRHNESITIKNIPERTNYDIEEVEANANDYQTFITGNQSGIMNDDVTVKYTNRKLSKQDLTISKEVTGAWASKDKEWTFTVKLTPSKDVYLNGFYHYEGSKEGEMELTNNSGIYTGKITLKSGESITLKEIPEGTAYEVSEDDANTDGYTTRVTGDTKGVLTFNTPTPHIAFENIKLSKHSLTISKEVTGGASDPDKEWTFSLTLTSKDGVTLLDSYPILGGNTASEVSVIAEKRLTLEKESDTKAKATFKLKGGQSITINDLPEGTTYEVKELEANTEGYDTRITGDEKGVLENVDTKSVKYVNHKALKYDLSIGKVVKGGAGEKDASWTFNITLTPMEGEELLTTYLVEGIEPSLISLTRTEDGYKGSLSLKHGDTATIKGIPENTGFKIEEVEANKNEYITEVNNPNTGILDKQLDPIIFTNTKLAKYNLTIVKTVKGNLGDKDKEWTFKVLLTPPTIKDLDKEYTYTKENAHGINLDGKMSLNKVSDHYEGEVSIKDQEKITIKDLPEGTTYQVVEQGAEADGYKVATDNDNGILNDHQMVKVTNTKVSYHDLQIESHLKGNNPDPEIEWDVEVTLTPSSDSGLEDSYVWVDDDGVSHLLPLTPNDDGTYTGHLSLKGNSYGTIKDLPYGTTYDVKVQNANQDGHKTTLDESSGVLSDNMEVTFTNERNLKIPNTLDDIMKYIIIFVMALIISSCGLYLYLQKRGTNN